MRATEEGKGPSHENHEWASETCFDADTGNDRTRFICITNISTAIVFLWSAMTSCWHGIQALITLSCGQCGRTYTATVPVVCTEHTGVMAPCPCPHCGSGRK